jgi:exonuclease SbcC
MIESLTLINFQRHKKLTLNFQEGVNCITGKTEAGKSTIIRALRFICLNPATRKSAKSVADPHIRHGADYCKVILKIDGHTIVRRKGKNGNYYRLDNGKPYNAIGNAVPDDISRILNLQQINWQRQLDSPFWLSDTAGQVSKHLNNLVNLESMDRALTNINSKLRVAKAEVTFIFERIKEVQQRKLELNWVPGFQSGVDTLNALDKQHATIANKRDSLGELIKVGVSHWHKQNNLKNVSVGGKNLVLMGDQLSKVNDRSKTLKHLIDDCESAERLSKLKVPDLTPILLIRKEGDRLSERRSELEDLIKQSQTLEKRICQTQKLLIKTTQDLKTQQRKVKVCKTCGQPLPS